MTEIGRLITAMVTPFDDEGRVDYAQAKRLANALLDSGSDGVIVSGTTGESPTLTTEEKIRLYGEIKDAIGDRGAVVAGTGNYSTAESIELSQEAEKAGVDGVLLVVPYYNKPPQEGLYQHFKAIAGSRQPALRALQRDQPHQPQHEPRHHHPAEPCGQYRRGQGSGQRHGPDNSHH